MKEIEHNQPVFEGEAHPVFSWEDGKEAAEIRRRQWQEKRMYKEGATVKIGSSLPITVFGISDIHFGSVYCDVDKFEKDMRAIEETPNTYAVLLSNLIDNGNPSQFPDSMLANSMTPNDQAKAMNDRLKRLDAQGKVLAAVQSPCHEGWLWKKMGIDINELLFADCKFPVLDNGGKLKVQMPGYEYKMALFHQFGPFGSYFNKNHPSQQLQRVVLGGWADIVMVAHSHLGEVLQTWSGVGVDRKDTTFIRTGSYKGNVSIMEGHTPDFWIKGKSGSDGEPGGEAVMLYPNERKMQTFLKPDQAIEFHNALYTVYRLQAAGLLGKIDSLINDSAV
jgi:hypothetical protein